MSSALQLKETEVTLLSCGRYYVHHVEICLFYALCGVVVSTTVFWMEDQVVWRQVDLCADMSLY